MTQFVLSAWEAAFKAEWLRQEAALAERYLKALLDAEVIIRNHAVQKSA